MASCASGAESLPPRALDPRAEEVLFASRAIGGDLVQAELSVPSAHCGGCISAIEKALMELEGVVSARLNLSTRRATVKWRKGAPVPHFVAALSRAGFEANLLAHEEDEADPEKDRLVRATAVAGFAATNIMLLSVSIWAGAGEATRDAFHVISALLAIPTVFYSGSVFFRSAWSALQARRTNMDVPISIGILLTLGLSVHETIRGEPHAYFDAVTSLIFFLLIGRTLDHLMRRRAKTAVLGLARLMPRGVTVLCGDESIVYKNREEVEPGEAILVAPGDRIPLDGVVQSGAADIDPSLVTGEAMPIAVEQGSTLVAGMLNLNGSLVVRVTQDSRGSFVSGMIRLMEAAEHGRARYRRLADRAAAYYSPIVHSLAAAAFIGWFVGTGDWHRSLTVAISVLIITCPCALGLAVPMVQVNAARRLFERGIALKDGSALERLAEVDLVVFDKTGTLTAGDLTVAKHSASGADLTAAVALAVRSRHPAARAIAALRTDEARHCLDAFRECPGQGIEARIGSDIYRLGRSDWALEGVESACDADGGTGATLSKNRHLAGHFMFSDMVRPQAGQTIAVLQRSGVPVEVLSGDRLRPVSELAASLGVERFEAELLPQDKVRRIESHREQGHKVLMVGDGLNDGPALSAAHVSMAPASAADVGRAAADLVFFGRGLMAVSDARRVAATARRLVRQNLALAIGYNIIVIPIALAGLVTPLMAAVAMSLSSILVVANSMRIGWTAPGISVDNRREQPQELVPAV